MPWFTVMSAAQGLAALTPSPAPSPGGSLVVVWAVGTVGDQAWQALPTCLQRKRAQSAWMSATWGHQRCLATSQVTRSQNLKSQYRDALNLSWMYHLLFMATLCPLCFLLLAHRGLSQPVGKSGSETPQRLSRPSPAALHLSPLRNSGDLETRAKLP